MASGSNLFQNQTCYSLFFEEFIGLIKYWQVQGQTIFWFILAKELAELKKKTTTEFETAGNGSNAHVLMLSFMLEYYNCVFKLSQQTAVLHISAFLSSNIR